MNRKSHFKFALIMVFGSIKIRGIKVAFIITIIITIEIYLYMFNYIVIITIIVIVKFIIIKIIVIVIIGGRGWVGKELGLVINCC